MSADMENSGGGKGNSRLPSRRSAKPNKLDHTLQELENAFADWENLNSAKAEQEAQAAQEETRRKAKATEKSEDEFKKKTRKLLSQLRQQLTDLND